MKISKRSCVATASILLGAAGGISHAADEGFVPFSDSLLYFQFRPRYEYADVDGGTDPGKAFTVRTVIGGKFNSVAGLKGSQLNIEATNASHFGIVDDYKTPSDPQKPFDIIADPPQTRITGQPTIYWSCWLETNATNL